MDVLVTLSITVITILVGACMGYQSVGGLIALLVVGYCIGRIGVMNADRKERAAHARRLAIWKAALDASKAQEDAEAARNRRRSA